MQSWQFYPLRGVESSKFLTLLFSSANRDSKALQQFLMSESEYPWIKIQICLVGQQYRIYAHWVLAID